MQPTALITGASRGIGAAVAIAFARAGHPVILAYRTRAQQAHALADALAAQHRSAIAVRADVSQPADVEALFAAAERAFSPVGILVNNAGISQQKLFTDITLEEWESMFATNVRGAFLCSRRALPWMISQKRGKIINVASMWGLVGASCEVHYSASKAALIGMTKALAKEVGPSGIQVNCVAPGVIQTPMNEHLSAEDLEILAQETPLQRLGTPQDVANAVYFLASPQADFITGQVLSSNGGLVI